MDHLVSINKLLSQPEAAILKNKATIIDAMSSFVEIFANPNAIVGSNKNPDEIRHLLSLLRESFIPPELEIMTAKVVKILVRKSINRLSLGKSGMNCIIKALIRQTERRSIATAEIGNVILNTCYNGDNVQLFIDEGGFPYLMKLLRIYHDSTSIQASILGAIQGMCYVRSGRQIIHDQEVGCKYIYIYIYIYI